MTSAPEMVGVFVRTAVEAASSQRRSDRVCAACVEALPVDGAGVSVRRGDGELELWGFSDSTARAIERLQATLAEGPCHEVMATRQPVLIPEFAATTAPQWPMFASVITQQIDVAALFCFPLQVSGLLLGTLDLYRREPGPLSEEAMAACLEIVDTAALLLLQDVLPDGAATEPGQGLDWGTLEGVVHIATGMVVAQLDVGPVEALARLRGQAFAHGQSLHELSTAVVRRQVRLNNSGDR